MILNGAASFDRDQAPWQARAATFAAVVTKLGDCAAMRFSCPEANLWRAAAEALNCIIASGLPAVNIAYVNAEGDPPEDAWPALATAFARFLLGSHLAAGGGDELAQSNDEVGVMIFSQHLSGHKSHHRS